MKTKIFLCLLTVGFLAGPARADFFQIDNQIQLYKWSVNGKKFFTDQEKDTEVTRLQKVATNTVTVEDITPPASDVVGSTVARTASDFAAVMNGDKKGILAIVREEFERMQFLVFLNNNGVDRSAELADCRQRLNWLAQLYKK